ncbi:MAG: RlmE family RNA methyltransferase [Holosporaceae bacterium]|nr:RlmE family RNA methyltransferase [Holosporaceae bacterium]
MNNIFAVKFNKGNIKPSSRVWLSRQMKDPYVKRAYHEGYRSRAAFKLLEIDDKFRLIRNAKFIIDLGSAPGGWSQVLAERSVNKNAVIASIDLQPFHSLDRIVQFCGDFEDKNLRLQIINYFPEKVSLIASDMAPPTSGHASIDHIRIMMLAESTWLFAQNMLANNGNLIIKLFQGSREKAFLESLRTSFRKVCFFKPKSSRSESSEIYVIAVGFEK